jgi:hypothetical protein
MVGGRWLGGVIMTLTVLHVMPGVVWVLSTAETLLNIASQDNKSARVTEHERRVI